MLARRVHLEQQTVNPTPRHPDFHIRVLGAEDVATAREMLHLFGRAFGDGPTYSARQPDDAYLQYLLDSDTFVSIVALAGHNVHSTLCRAIRARAARSTRWNPPKPPRASS